MTPAQGFRRIALPQAFYYSIPNLGNTLIFLLKDGALGFTIGLVDVMGKATIMNSNTHGVFSMDIYVALVFIYWPLAIIIERVFVVLERKFRIDGIGAEDPENKRGQNSAV
jgi:L-cystine transport system permease protein